MKLSSYKNRITGETVTFETGSRGDRKVKAAPEKYQLISTGAVPTPVKPDSVKPETKKPEKSG